MKTFGKNGSRLNFLLLFTNVNGCGPSKLLPVQEALQSQRTRFLQTSGRYSHISSIHDLQRGLYWNLCHEDSSSFKSLEGRISYRSLTVPHHLGSSYFWEWENKRIRAFDSWWRTKKIGPLVIDSIRISLGPGVTSGVVFSLRSGSKRVRVTFSWQ